MSLTERVRHLREKRKNFYTSLALNDRMSMVLLTTGAILSTIALIISIAFGMPFFMHLPHVLMIFICIGFPIIFKNSLTVASFTALYFVSFVYFPFVYYTNNGINGSGPYYFIMIIVYFAFYRKGLRLVGILSALVVFYIGVILSGYFFPQLITEYPDTISQYIDIVISLISVSIVLSVIASLTYIEYNKEKDIAIKLASDLEDRNKKLRLLTITDPLTNVYSRQYLMDALQRELDLDSTAESAFYVMMIDIDHFKKVNDTFGHLYGDKVLCMVADKIKDNVRQHDLVARYGGEEFLVLLSHISYDDCIKIANRIKDAVEKAYYRNETNVTVSIGVAKGGLSLSREEVINNADMKMYEAKAGGRNKIMVAK